MSMGPGPWALVIVLHAVLVPQAPPFDVGAASRKVEITEKMYGGYPAVILSVETGKITKIPGSKAALAKMRITGDLWIEPDDPEISGLTKDFEGATHLGNDTKVATVPGVKFQELKTVPPDVKWKRKIERSSIKTGLLFLVRTSNDLVAKVLVAKSSERSMTLEYQIIGKVGKEKPKGAVK